MPQDYQFSDSLNDILRKILQNQASIIRGTSSLKVTATSPVTAPAYTVATLPAAASYPYSFAFVTDSTATAITGLGLAPVGGGGNKVPVFSDGTSWLVI